MRFRSVNDSPPPHDDKSPLWLHILYGFFWFCFPFEKCHNNPATDPNDKKHMKKRVIFIHLPPSREQFAISKVVFKKGFTKHKAMTI